MDIETKIELLSDIIHDNKIQLNKHNFNIQIIHDRLSYVEKTLIELKTTQEALYKMISNSIKGDNSMSEIYGKSENGNIDKLDKIDKEYIEQNITFKSIVRACMIAQELVKEGYTSDDIRN